MSMAAAGTKPVQFRLPGWARDFLDEKSQQTGSTKTDVVVIALQCLKEKEMAALMAEGYLERACLDSEMAEENMAIASETWPEWD